MPNVKNYYIANQLRVIGDIIYNKEKLIWWEMESLEINGNAERYLFNTLKRSLINQMKNTFLRNLLNIWNKYKEKFCPSTSPLKLVTEIESFPTNLKDLLELFKNKRAARLKDWMCKMSSKELIMSKLQTNKLSWYNLIQLDTWTKDWLKTNGKCREPTKYEQFLSSHEDMQDTNLKGIVSKIYTVVPRITSAPLNDESALQCGFPHR